MKTKDPSERTWLKGLSVECALGKPLPSCPLNGLRNLPSLQIKHIIGRMSDRQIHTAIETHRQCYKERLEALQKA